MGVIITMAIGKPVWGELALNLCLSIKANNPNQKVMLIHDDTAVSSIQPILSNCFDTLYTIGHSYKSCHNLAFNLKTQLHSIATKACVDETRFLYIDADCIFTTSAYNHDWFKELDGQGFAAWNNGCYDFESKERVGKGYTFWFDVERIGEKSGKIPQFNTSFIYFERFGIAKTIFQLAQQAMESSNYGEVQLYKGATPDEYCFNVACWEADFMPKEIPFKPIFFQFANDYQNTFHVLHNYKIMGFAGEHIFSKWFVHLYNELSYYYREYFGLRPYDYKPKKKLLDTEIIKLDAVVTELAKAGQYPNSDGGIFNPDGKIYDGKLVTVYRKERNLDAYKKTYTHNTAIACFNKDLDVESLAKYRVEDFRLFTYKGDLWTNFSCVGKDKTWISISKATPIETTFMEIDEVKLPIETNKVEKNWVFFEHDNHLFCIYSLQPYIVFCKDYKLWYSFGGLKEVVFDWFHKGHTICNSTNPIDIGEFYLMFFHTKESGTYFHGAVLIDKATLNIRHYTSKPIHIIDECDGLHDDLIYVSGSVYLERQQIIRLYFGAADSHSMSIDFNKSQLVEAIINNK